MELFWPPLLETRNCAFGILDKKDPHTKDLDILAQRIAESYGWENTIAWLLLDSLR